MGAIFCVLRSGGEYKAKHVETLYKNIASYLPKDMRFVCLSDVDVPCERLNLSYGWSGWYAKMEICRPDIAGDMLYIDLDTVVVGSLDGVLAVRRTTVLRDFYWDCKPNKNRDSVGSGLMYLTAEDRARVWQYWSAAPQARQREAGEIGDQQVFQAVIGETADRWQDVLPGQILSYKADIKKPGRMDLPPEARIVCFHGKPRPWNARGKWWRPYPWLRSYT